MAYPYTTSSSSSGYISCGNGFILDDWTSAISTNKSKERNVIDYSDDALFTAISELIAARNKVDQIKELRRMAANKKRIDANQQDAMTNQVVEEANEIAKIPFDYEPVQPIEDFSDDD